MKSLLNDKMGKLKTSTLNTAIVIIILIVVLFQVYSEVVPEAQAAGDGLNDTNTCEDAGGTWCASGTSGNCTNNATEPCVNNATSIATAVSYGSIPLNSLFSSTGVVFVIVMAALLILVVFALLKKGKK